MRVTTASLPGLEPVFVRIQLHQKIYAAYLVGTALRGSLEPTNHAANGLAIGVHSSLRGWRPRTFDNDVEKQCVVREGIMGNLCIEFAQALDDPLVLRGGNSEGVTSGDTGEILGMLNGNGTGRGRFRSVFERQCDTLGLELLHGVLRNVSIAIDFCDHIHRRKHSRNNFG